jgi:20S proteasome subunit alpha 6
VYKPCADPLDEGSAKKRSTYLLTHGKTNDLAAPENNQNRFRIYFESPPEADRVPQALRRNPYKRWRREDSAAPATAQDAKKGDSSLPEIAEISEGVASQGGAEENDKSGEAHATSNGESALVANEESEDATVAETSGTAEEASVDPASTDAPVDTIESGDVEQGNTSGTANGHDQLNAAELVDDATAPAAESTDVPDESLAVSPDSVAPAVQATDASDAILSEFIAAHAEESTDEAILSDPVDAEAVAAPTASVESTTAPDDASTMPPPPSSDSIEPTLLSGEAEPSSEQDPATSVPQKATSEEDAAALAKSAENAASAYKTRTRRRSSVSSTDSRDTVHAFQPEVTPSLNRLSILYEGSQRRMCFDAEVVEKIKVFREEGRIEVLFLPVAAKEDEAVTDETEDHL